MFSCEFFEVLRTPVTASVLNLVLKKFRLGKDVVKWIETLLKMVVWCCKLSKHYTIFHLGKKYPI